MSTSINDIFEITGTIITVYPTEVDKNGNFLQKVILANANGINTNIIIGSRVLVLVKFQQYDDLIEFKVNDPITVKGHFVKGNNNFLDTIHTVHAPTGYLRYNGKIYR